MIKWIVKRYLNNKLEDLNYQILRLEQELGYANYLTEDEVGLIQAHKENIWNRNNLECVINYIK